MAVKNEIRAGRQAEYLTRLRQVTAVMSAGVPADKQLNGILQTATEITGASCAWLYVSASQATTLGLSGVDSDPDEDSEFQIGPKARLVSKGPIAEQILKHKGAPQPALLEDRTGIVLPLPQGGMLIRTAETDGLHDQSLYLALYMLVNMATSVLSHADEQNVVLRRAKELEQLHQQLLSKNMELRERTMVDDLTGLYNRRFFQRSLAYELDRFGRYGHCLGIILFDVDHFKRINDRYGHTVGDRALKHLSKVAQRSVRSADLLARYGGEEFVVLLPDTDMNGSTVTGERLRAAVERAPFEVERTQIQVTISAGVTALEQDFSGDADQIMRKVDRALYEAKQNGRNQVAVTRV